MAKKTVFLKGFIILALLASGATVFYTLTATREHPNRGSSKAASSTVQVVKAQQRDVPIVIAAMGEVQPARSVDVMPQVSGRVVFVNPNLFPGGMVKKNEILFRVDARDYDLALRSQQALVAGTQLLLEEQEGRRAAAKRELEMVDEALAPTAHGMRLASRESHMENARAQLDGAMSRLDRARLDRARTVLRAPFDARITKKSIDKGQVVSTQTVVAHLIDAHEVWVEATLPVDSLQWIDVPGMNSEKGSEVNVRQRIKGSREVVRQGQVLGLLPGLDEKGKLARLLIGVKDPFDLGPDSELESSRAFLPLLIGSFVQIEIQGHTIPGLVAIPHSGLRDGDRVWIRDEKGCLAIRSVETIWKDDNTVYVKGDLQVGEEAIVSRLATAIPGMLLTLEQAQSSDQTVSVPDAGKIPLSPVSDRTP